MQLLLEMQQDQVEPQLAAKQDCLDFGIKVEGCRVWGLGLRILSSLVTLAALCQEPAVTQERDAITYYKAMDACSAGSEWEPWFPCLGCREGLGY